VYKRQSLNRSGGKVRLTITDDGKGFEPTSASPLPKGSGWGLTNMRERAELIGGRLNLVSVPGKGTVVEVEVKVAR
jgi:signal transduction histidine kinase